jgi:exodeoxyribonuclease VII small subunit
MADEKQRNGELKFEEAMTQLEDIVRTLEAGDVPLEDSLAAFEKGVGLVRVLHARLDAVQEKIEELTRTEKGEPATKPFESE